MSIAHIRKEAALTEFHISGTPAKVGRKKLWTERLLLSLAEGTRARLDDALRDGEDRLDLIRTAIEAELKRRERLRPKSDG